MEAFTHWKEQAEQNSCCDFALSVAVPQVNHHHHQQHHLLLHCHCQHSLLLQVDDQTKGDMEQLAKELGVNSFKLFMSKKGDLMLSNADMLEAFKHIKDLGGVAKVSHLYLYNH